MARYALPQLLPACWRYELRPPGNTAVHYGASVPLFGQSGGGVEVSFPSTFKNSGPILSRLSYQYSSGARKLVTA